MSFKGKFTPLQLNVASQLRKNSGLKINTKAAEYFGTWTTTSYTQGSITSSTVLGNLTTALNNFYNLANSTTLDVEIYRNLLKIGRPIDVSSDNRINCPALGNSRPDDFQTSYPGFGSWQLKNVDAFYNISTTSVSLNMIAPEYPPKEYPVSGNFSYMYVDWGSTSAGSYTYEYQWKYPYSWVIGWPGRSSFQESDDNYAAAYFPRPDLRVRDVNLIEYDNYFKYGFIATIAQQAYYEFWSAYNTRRVNQYKEFATALGQTKSWKNTRNELIASFVNSKKHLRGTYSNINDLTTSDISGVSLSFKLFGDDLIRLGKSLDLSQIHRFGLPSIFVNTLQKNNALTDALKLAMLLNNLTTTELNDILTPTYTPTAEQEKKLYDSLLIIKGADLEDIKIIVNCTTNNLQSLADLLEPKKMFPNSFSTLTIPTYSVDTQSSKTYDFIYINNGVNDRIENWGTYLTNILPDDIAVAAGAFMMTMNQIKNIRLMNLESFAQVVSNLEVTNKNLALVNSGDSVAVNIDQIDDSLEMVALGSGNSGSYRFCDFFGSMSGQPYNSYFKQVIPLIQKIQTTQLSVIYEKLLQKSLGNDWALVSRGKGWTDSVINPTPVWASTYAYTLFVTQSTHASGTNTVSGQDDLTGIFTAATQIAFVSSPGVGDIYTVSTSTFDGTNTTITLTTNLTTTIAAGTKLYIFENTYNGYPSGPVQDLIDAANLEILRITSLNTVETQSLNYYWNKIGEQLFIEQRAIPYAITSNENVFANATETDLDSFCKNLDNWALENQFGEIGSILEAIGDEDVIGGQSLIASLREARNAKRILNTGGDLDNSVSNNIDTYCASAVSYILNGVVERIEITSGGSGYDATEPPNVLIGPNGGVFGGSGSGATAIAVVDSDTTFIKEIIVTNGGSGYDSAPLITIDCPKSPTRLGNATTPGSFSTSPYTGQFPVPDNLVTDSDASLSVNEAIQDVTLCNCDCWST